MRRSKLTDPRKRLALGCFVLSLILFAAVIAQAQTPLASVTGVVTDPSGAVVPNVKVTVTDIARGTPYTATNQRARGLLR